ncbi:MAG: hypothetical protein CO113_15740 [Elusimicrobia bacterium CG_4_9_14_3_um_filter_62_55]|nr:MAG: hypothetical protein COR54_13870 [Elusimicrobia bacterium CG22_combo_CG10-13_8_21_14_all_63_91]PJA16747.1 MAG: hypothetical protein COX66_06770 [Elusimicrobia bacterium CG_4_10_14_0_2_um_filter_63_34]PJB24093.1 MAG: hypothetical protein CO113_15740 [Elusimicrobia bacterium CG_4_9_14_3_um_filter_62_55]
MKILKLRRAPLAISILFASVAAAFIACDNGSKDEEDTNYPDIPIQFQCVKPGKHCLSSADCCGGSTCSDNFCSGSNLGAGLHCRSSSDCGGASVCTGDVCTATSPQACSKPGDHCDTSGDCCGGSTCGGGFCSSTGSCFERGKHCGTSADCCGALTCSSVGSGPKVCL